MATVDEPAEYTKLFKEVVGDENGVLNEAQYAELDQKYVEHLEKNFEISMPDAGGDFLQTAYGVVNKLTPGTEGISLADLLKEVKKRDEICTKLFEE